jgi:hypothetical protein
MRPYEFQFNPGSERDLIFDSFCYSPENIYERRMGGVFMVGEIKKALPHNFRLLEKIAGSIRKEFYSKFQRTHEQALKESLRKANDLLAAEVSRENTDWLGNLGFAIISLKNFELNFTKVGGIKIFLLRRPHIIDIGEKLDKQEIEPYPLKIFNNIVSGKLGEGDIIVMVTEGIFPSLKEVIKEISEAPVFDEKKIRLSLEKKKSELANFSGSLVFITVSKIQEETKRPKVVFEREKERFSMAQVLLPITKNSKKVLTMLKKIPVYAESMRPRFKFSFKLPKPNLNFKKQEKEKPYKEPVPVKIQKGPIKVKVKVETDDKKSTAKKSPAEKIRFKMPGIKIPKIKFSFKLPKFKMPKLKFSMISGKKYIYILLLALMLVIGFFAFRGEERRTQNENKTKLDSISEKVTQAEILMPQKDVNPEAGNTAYSSLSEAWSEIISLAKIEWSYKTQAQALKIQIETDLEDLSNLVKIENPETVFQFSLDEFIPQRIISDGQNLYFFSPYAANIFKVDANRQGTLFKSDKKFNSALALSQDNILLFTKPDNITPFSNGQFGEISQLKSPYNGSNFNDLAYFEGNFYFLDGDNGEIIKYGAPISDGKNHPIKWLTNAGQKPLNGKSIAVDGYIWVLNENNEIFEYRVGSLQTTMTANLFPLPKNFSKIETSPNLPYIFILEPAQNRVIIMDKQGKLVKQLQSDDFNNLLDFAISEDGQTIFVLNGLKVYKINY